VSVRSVLEVAVGADLAARFAVFAGDVVAKKKPAPDIYLLTIEQMHLAPQDVVVVEDSRNGMRAALAAGLTCVITVSSYTGDEDFTGAALVVSSLGDPDTDAEVLSDPQHLAPHPYVRLDDLRALLPDAARSTLET
jgi:beta-phosphoglucomutase-like phosphatase (HAD superfamily)